MDVKREYDFNKLRRLARASGSESVVNAVEYIHAPWINQADGFVTEVYDDVAFFSARIGGKKLRLYAIAVAGEKQGAGYGNAMMARLKMLCQENGLACITLRVSKEEGRVGFYIRHGGKIVGEHDGDYEVEI